MSDEIVAKLLSRNRIGALVRVFASTPEAVEYQIDSVLKTVERLLAVSVSEKSVFSRIDLLVSSDQDFLDSDCGLTAERLRTRVLNEYHGRPVHVLEISKGDIFCTLLNYGIAN